MSWSVVTGTTRSTGFRAVPTRLALLAVGTAVVLFRLVYLADPVRRDEAGYLLVARGWTLGGPNLYGHYFVDRPPGLIGLYKVASVVPWTGFVRILSMVFALMFVAGAAWGAHLVAGPAGARWAALAAGACVSTPAMAAEVANAEIFAAPFVMLSVALTLSAVRCTGRPSLLLAAAAGLTAACAVAVKQNFVDGFVFAAVLLLSSVVQGHMSRVVALRLLLAGASGAAVVLLAAVGYALRAGVGIHGLWFTLFGVRGLLLQVFAHAEVGSLARGVASLFAWAVLSGLLACVGVLVCSAARSGWTGGPVAWATGATLTCELVAILGGGGFSAHYFVQAVPMMALAIGAWARHSRGLRSVAVFMAVSAVLVLAVVRVTGLDDVGNGERVGAWLQASARPGDTLTVMYENTQLQLASGMDSPYQQLWILPARAMDPRLADLRRVLDGPRAPVWVVYWRDAHVWSADARQQLIRRLRTDYHRVARVCGHGVWLHDGQPRRLAPLPRCGG